MDEFADALAEWSRERLGPDTDLEVVERAWKALTQASIAGLVNGEQVDIAKAFIIVIDLARRSGMTPSQLIWEASRVLTGSKESA